MNKKPINHRKNSKTLGENISVSLCDLGYDTKSISNNDIKINKLYFLNIKDFVHDITLSRK